MYGKALVEALENKGYRDVTLDLSDLTLDEAEVDDHTTKVFIDGAHGELRYTDEDDDEHDQTFRWNGACIRWTDEYGEDDSACVVSDGASGQRAGAPAGPRAPVRHHSRRGRRLVREPGGVGARLQPDLHQRIDEPTLFRMSGHPEALPATPIDDGEDTTVDLN